MPRETEVGVMVDDKEVKMRLRSLKLPQVREARKKAGMQYDTSTGKIVGDYFLYIEICVSLALKNAGNEVSIELLDEVDYNKLAMAYQKIIKPSEDEKGFLPKP